MIITFLSSASESEVLEVQQFLQSQGCDVRPLDAVTQPAIEVIRFAGDPHTIANRTKGFGCVATITMNQPSNRVLGSIRTVEACGTIFGGRELTVIAGPCSVESEEQLFAVAEFVSSIGIRWMRGGAYKPSTSPYGFQGGGVGALEILSEAKRRYGLKVVTEVTDPRNVGVVSEVADMLQIGARNMQNFDLLREVGMGRTPILLKRGMGARVEEWALAAEHVAVAGNHNIVLCERGIRTFENATRATLDLAAVAVAKSMTGLPVIVDPSHAAGRRDLVPILANAAVAAGADGLLIEVHPNPEHALKDGAQSLTFDQLSDTVQTICAVAASVGREVGMVSAGVSACV